jgi:hypothetical protein
MDRTGLRTCWANVSAESWRCVQPPNGDPNAATPRQDCILAVFPFYKISQAIAPYRENSVADLGQVQSTELVNYPGIRLTLQLANNPRFLRWIIHSEAGCQIVH